ncbi:MAG TPA: acyltransferase family protein, partial [Gammaproteobacteria bacterium]
MEYRREIDGLRALAVLPVILFHAGFQTFSGGFVGVDIFFVISGYLITSIILLEKQAGTFTLSNFYERRARRILPALFLVMFVCLPFAWPWLLPADMEDFSLSLVAVAGFAANILFWQTSGYFETNAELHPLLHTWSLAVEEQYYLFFPVFLIATWRLGIRWIAFLLVIAGSLSLAVAEWGSLHKPAATFYLLPTRGWELLIGALVAFYFFGRKPVFSELSNQAGSSLGILLILYAIFAFDEQTPFPGLHALVPTVGAALIILFATPRTLVGRLLSNKLLVGIGLISYSAYLWHQPLFAFARHRSVEEPDKLLLAALAVTAIVLAYFSWKYVEVPCRNKQRFKRKQVFAYGIAGSFLFAMVGLTGFFNDGFEYRLTAEQNRISAYSQYDATEIYRRHKCFIDPGKTYRDFSSECQNIISKDEALLLWGDSYAAALSKGLRTYHDNVVQYTASACPPVIDT